MSAPDRIIAWRKSPGDRHGKWEDGPVHWLPATGTRWYAAIDPAVLAALPEVQAMLAAKLEDAAALPLNIIPYSPELKALLDAITAYRDAIRALITPDMAQALADRDERVRREERERCARIVDKRAEDYDREFGIYDYSTGVTEYPGTGSESMEEWEEIAAAIRAEGGSDV